MEDNSWRQKSLKYAFYEIVFGSLFAGLTANFFAPFALKLNASNFDISMLTVLPVVFSALIQLFSPVTMERYPKRARFTGISICLQVIFLMMALITPVLFKLKISYAINIFIVFIVLSTMSASLSGPVWLSLMSETVQKKEYGKYFAWRSKISTIISLFVSFIAGFALDLFKGFRGFMLIFFIAGICRIISGFFVSKMTEVPFTIKEEDRFSYFDFISRLPESNYAKFTMYLALMNFTVVFAGPFFAVYMLKELHFSYFTYNMVILSAALSTLLSLAFWGLYADKIGSIKIIKICSIFISVLPALWLLSSNPIYLCVINFLGGYVWAGFSLAAGNFTLHAVRESKRVRAISYNSLTVGIFVFIGGITGGLLLPYMPHVKGSQILAIITLSAILRLFVYLLFSKSFSEVQEKVEPMEDRDFIMSVLWVKPVVDSVNSFANEYIFRKK